MQIRNLTQLQSSYILRTSPQPHYHHFFQVHQLPGLSLTASCILAYPLSSGLIRNALSFGHCLDRVPA